MFFGVPHDAGRKAGVCVVSALFRDSPLQRLPPSEHCTNNEYVPPCGTSETSETHPTTMTTMTPPPEVDTAAMYGYEDADAPQATLNSGDDDLGAVPLPSVKKFPERPSRRAGWTSFRSISTQQGPQQQQRQQNNSQQNHASGRDSQSTTATAATAASSAATNLATNFAVQSIRRGSQEWRTLVKPFVADLCYENLTSRAFSRQPMVRPFTTQAAVLFVDISGYSKISAALAERGAHALSTAVNAYLSRILRLVRHYGGDVVKFAGDAVLCVWYGDTCDNNNSSHGDDSSRNKEAPADPEEVLASNIVAAALCATQLQEQCATHAVAGTPHVFRIHVGLCAGTVESEIFAAPAHVHMQRLFHLVGGEALHDIGDLVDTAKAGQVCVSGHVAQVLQTQKDVEVTLVPVSSADADDGMDGVKFMMHGGDEDEDDDEDSEAEQRCGPPQLLTHLTVNASRLAAMELQVEETMICRLNKRSKCMEEEFIHPAVLDLLSHGGQRPTQIAQMRDLVVLFIAQTSHGSPANWLLQVQAILDRNQCPLLQIVADDKGVHAIAAVNAVSSVPESRLLGLEICRQLVKQQVGVAIGMAAGSTFCGVTGSSSVACRWDITGEKVVRAARLMQYALKHNVPLALDESLAEGSNTVPARMSLLHDSVSLKGTSQPIRVFTLSEATEFSAMNLLETVHGDVHMNQVHAISKHLHGRRHRSTVVVTGPTLAGKKIVCQRAAGLAGMVPFLHVSDSSYGLLQLVRTVAKWFKYVDNEKVRKRAKDVLNSFDNNLLSRAHDECLALVDDAMDAELDACFVVDRVEFLDDFSISFIRECLHGRRYRQAFGETKLGFNRPKLLDSLSNISVTGESSGRIAFLCVHVPMYNSPTAKSVVDDITRSHRSLSVPLIEVGQVTMDEFRTLFGTMSKMKFDDRLIYTGAAGSGYCVGYAIERQSAISLMLPARLRAGLKPIFQVTEDLRATIPTGYLREFRKIPVMKVGSHIAMRFGHVYDELPPIMQVFCKVLAVASQTEYYWAPRQRIWEVLNDLIAEGVDYDTMSCLLEEMKSMYLINVWNEDGSEFVKFLSPAMADIAMDVCTPVQVEAIAKAWIDRLEEDRFDDFRVSLVLAWLHSMIDPCKNCPATMARLKSFWQEGYETMLTISKDEAWNESKENRWKELIASEIVAAGFKETDVLGADFCYKAVEEKGVDPAFMRVWWYRGPVSLGPLGNTLSVIGGLLVDGAMSFESSFDEEMKHKLRRHLSAATSRYLVEVEILEELLTEHELGTTPETLERERGLIEQFRKHPVSKSQAIEFTKMLMECIIPEIVEPRVERLRSLAKKLGNHPLPPFVANVSCDAILQAYRVMYEMFCNCKSQGSEVDSAQHALMVLATRGWEPRPPPAPINHLFRQTVARLRNAVVRKLSEGDLHYKKHQQSAVDLKAFLITTSLLFDAQDRGRYSVE